MFRSACPNSPLRRRCRALLPAAALVGLVACGPEHGSSPWARLSRAAADQPDQVHRLVRFDGVVQPGARQALERRGVRLLLRRGGGWWLAVGPPAALTGDLLGHHGLLEIRRPAPLEKLSDKLRARLAEGEARGPLSLWALVSAADRRPLSWLAAHDPGARRVGFAPIYLLRLPAAGIQRLAAEDSLRHLDLAPGPAIPELDESRKLIGVDQLHAADTNASPPVYDLGGAGTVGAVWDPQGIEPTHEDLADNLVRWANPTLSSTLSHGTAVGGCMAGSGALSSTPPDFPWKPYQLRGVAPEAQLLHYLTNNDQDSSGKPSTFLQQYLEARDSYGADAINFSFSLGYRAVYTASGVNLDTLIRATDLSLPDPVPIVQSAGNYAKADGYGSISGFASTKNTLSVGATDWANGTLVDFSSLGPTADGRLKPEVTAPGCSSHGKTRVGLDRVRIIPTSGAAKDWTFASDVEGWKIVRHLDKLTVSGGVMQATTTGHDPGVYSPAALKLDPKVYNKLEITLRADRHHRAELFWKTDKGGFHGKRMKGFFINADDKLHTYKLDLSQHKEWKNTILQIRIDPIATGLIMPRVGNTYWTSCGTSMSSPITAGGILLMVQAWRRAHGPGTRPTPALVKALLVATARDMVGQGPGTNPDTKALTVYPRGPDYATGYGEVNIKRAVGLIQQAAAGRAGYLQASLARTGSKLNARLRLKGTLPPSLSVTLAWDDPPGEPGSKAVLQNDLDLTVTPPGVGKLLPWVLDPQNPTRAATTGSDRINNLEQVPIPGPLAGDYVITVEAHELASGPQPLSLVVSDVTALESLVLDADGDGSYADKDCDDRNSAVHPGAREILGNGVDDDCDPLTPDSLVDAALPDSGAAALDAGFGAPDGAVPAPPPASGCSAAGGVAGWPGLLVVGLLLAGGWVRRRYAARPKAETATTLTWG